MPAPLTAFEQRGHTAPWTSYADGESFLAALDAYSPKISMATAGVSVNDRPMRVLKIGTGPRKVLFVGQVHGAELSGREALFTMLREWADSTDPALLDYLSEVTVLVMPTCHPDNFSVRENANGVNLNRDHVQLTQPETQAIHAVIRDEQPDLIVDLHEGQNITNHYASQGIHNTNADTAIRGLSDDLNTVVKGAIEGAGYTWEVYQGPVNMMRGPENLANHAGVRGRVGLLLETRRVGGDDSDAATRHELQLIALDAIWRWHAARVNDLASEVAAARSRIAANTSPLMLQVENYGSGPVVDPVPTRYYVTPEQYHDLAIHRDRFDLTFQAEDYGYSIGTADPEQTVLIYLLHPTSPQKVADASLEPLDPPPPPPKPGLVGPITISPDTVMKFRHNGKTYTARLKA